MPHALSPSAARHLVLLFAIAAAGVLSVPQRAVAQSDHTFGLGLIIGDPTGLTLKGFLTQDTAIDGAVGIGVLGGDDLHVHADFLWHFEVKRWDSAALLLYLGVGPELGLRGAPHPHPPDDHDHVFIGARGPFGLAVMFNAPFDVFLEVAAGLWLIEDVRFHLDAAIGGRYWF
jgi:hypothetical protein